MERHNYHPNGFLNFYTSDQIFDPSHANSNSPAANNAAIKALIEAHGGDAAADALFYSLDFADSPVSNRSNNSYNFDDLKKVSSEAESQMKTKISIICGYRK